VVASADTQLTGGEPSIDAQPAARPLKVFINYRHDDARETAWNLYLQLKLEFGAENVFFDSGSLRPGQQWLDEIESRLAGGGAFIALIGARWMSTLREHRQRGGRDFVAEEIDLALRSESPVTVIPTLIDDVELPPTDELAPSLWSLHKSEAQRLRYSSLEDDITRLIARLHEVADELGSRPPEGSGPELRTKIDEEPGPEPRTKIDEEPVEKPQPKAPRAEVVAPPPDESHYQQVVEDAEAIVVFLGAGVNSEDCPTLPDDRALARKLAQKVGLEPAPDDLAAVAEYVRTIKGETKAFKLVREILSVDCQPGEVHRYLARFPKRLKELGLKPRYQLIVTAKYDAALERAFRDAKEPFDVAVYMGPGTDQPGVFVHLPWDGEPVAITMPNKYRGFRISAADDELDRTLIVRINGAVGDEAAGFRWTDSNVNNYVITQDHFIDYLSSHSAEDLVPAQILAKLRNSSCLFLGYRLSEWRLRVFLKRIWPGDRLRRGRHWAIERDPDILEQKLWPGAGSVTLYQSSLGDWVRGLDAYLVAHQDELRARE
jgi:SIR2-like domain/TIR domain